MAKLLRAVLPMLVALLISACAAPQPYWYKEGVSREATKDAYAECRYEIGMSDKTGAEKQELLTFCMERHGFRLRR